MFIISIHSPYTGRDGCSKGLIDNMYVFQSTLPIQGETQAHSWMPLSLMHFNPLSLYRERLGSGFWHPAVCLYFNPLSLYRERLRPFYLCYYYNDISIHSPYTGRDEYEAAYEQTEDISIHSPYTGRDAIMSYLSSIVEHFNPLSLYRERLCCSFFLFLLFDFNPLSLYRERPIMDETTE